MLTYPCRLLAALFYFGQQSELCLLSVAYQVIIGADVGAGLNRCSHREFVDALNASAASTEQLAERASKLGRQRRIEDEVRRTVDHHEHVRHSRRQPEIDRLPRRR